MNKILYKEDCQIIRDGKKVNGIAYPNSAVVVDGDGETAFVCPDKLTYDEIMALFVVINKYYDLGVRIGMGRKADEIKKVLGL